MTKRILPMILALALLGGCAGDGAGETTSISVPAVSTSSMPAGPTTSSAVPSTSTSTTAAAPSSTTTTAEPAPSPGPSVSAKEYARLPVGERKLVAFTFDAAYDPAPLTGILTALDLAGVPATFFLTGEFVEDFPDSVGAIVSAGHPIGNHSYSHPDFTKLSLEETQQQLRRTEELLAGVGASDPRPLFRPPFGARNDRVLARLGEQGYVSIYWTVDTLDWKPERTPDEIRRAVLQGLRPGAIILMHVGSKQTEQILPSLIENVRELGYEFVTVREALPDG